MKKMLIINGPNLNMLGVREPETYGNLSLQEIQSYTRSKLTESNVNVITEWFQSNSESKIIERIHELTNEKIDALVINPAAYSHTSIAILDALHILEIPIVEVHLSNVYRRESFRETMLTAKASSIIMSGLGKDAYYYGIIAALEKCN